MVRKLKYHEKKLLKKVDLTNWDLGDNNESKVIRKYNLTNREDYSKYKKLIADIVRVINKIKELDVKDPFRVGAQKNLLDKLYNCGLIQNRKFSECQYLSVSSICRRRLSVILVKLGMTQRVSDACNLIQHSHIRIGTDVVNDPALIVTRAMEDFVTWTDSSKVKQHVVSYHDNLDDFELNL